MSLLLAICFQAALPYSAWGSYSESASWFASLPHDERLSIQSDLLLMGYYDLLVDGAFGPGTFKAITRFEMGRSVTVDGVLANGVLNPDERDDLGLGASEIYASLGFELVRDGEAETDLYLPTTLVPVVTKTKRGKSYLAANGGIAVETIHKPFAEETFSDLFASLTDPAAGREVTYSNYATGRFVVSGIQRGRGFYLLFYRGIGRSVGFSVSWSHDQARLGSLVSLYVASHFFPWESRAPEADPSASRPEAAPPHLRVPEEQAPAAEVLGSFVIFEEDRSVIALSGPITNGTPLDLRRALKARPGATLLLLDSNGGFVDGALVLAHEIHDRGFDTYVPPGAVCFSACAYVFLAGTDRAVDGALGVHQVWNDANDLVSGQAKLSDVLEAFQEFGVPRQVESIMLRTPPEQMYVFTASEVEDMGLSTGYPLANPPDEVIEQPAPTHGGSKTGRLADGSEVAAGNQSLLLEDSDDANSGAVPFSGTVEWSKGVDHTGQATLQAKARIPARRLGVDILIRKNMDPALPASHLIEVEFSLSDEFIGGSIAGLPGVLLKSEEMVQGTPLIGPSGVRVAANIYLFALSAAPEDAATNVTLMTTQKWMDLFLIYGSGKRAILTLEKDDSAEEMFTTVFSSWKDGGGVYGLRPAAAYVQLATLRSWEEARYFLRQAETRWGNFFHGATLEIEASEVEARAGHYRVLLAATSVTTATDACEAIKNNGGDCFVRAGMDR